MTESNVTSPSSTSSSKDAKEVEPVSSPVHNDNTKYELMLELCKLIYQRPISQDFRRPVLVSFPNLKKTYREIIAEPSG